MWAGVQINVMIDTRSKRFKQIVAREHQKARACCIIQAMAEAAEALNCTTDTDL